MATYASRCASAASSCAACFTRCCCSGEPRSSTRRPLASSPATAVTPSGPFLAPNTCQSVGQNTTSNSSPLALWIVRICTASLSVSRRSSRRSGVFVTERSRATHAPTASTLMPSMADTSCSSSTTCRTFVRRRSPSGSASSRSADRRAAIKSAIAADTPRVRHVSRSDAN